MKLGELCEINMGQSPKSEYYNADGQGLPFLQGNRTFGTKYPTFDTYTTLATKVAEAGDVIMSVRAPVGDVNITPVTMCLGRGVCSLRHKKGEQEFLYYLMRYYASELINRESGTVFGSVNRADIANLEVVVPPLSEQKEIGRTLGALDDRIENNSKINHHLEQMAQAIFKSWFVDFEPFGGVMPDDWREGTFSEVISTTLGGDWGKDAPTGNNTQEVYCIRGADIPDVNVGNKGKMPTRFILPKNYVSKRLAVGDIMVEISGGSPTQSTGRCALITQSLLDRYDRGMVCTNFCRAVKPSDGYSAFVYFYWKYLYDQRVMFSYENGTTGIKNLDITGFLENEPIIIPPVGVVAHFTEAVEIFINTIFANGLENEGLATTRDALLPRLMSGELSVADLSDAK